jgi:hypothetical protein
MPEQEPAYSAKLKQAAEEIQAIFKKYDIAGVACLHTNKIIEGVEGKHGAGEYIAHLVPSYSALEFVRYGERNGFVIKGRKAHYGDDPHRRDVQLRDTANMMRILCDLLAMNTLGMIDIQETVQKALGHDHTEGTHTGGNPQNN